MPMATARRRASERRAGSAPSDHLHAACKTTTASLLCHRIHVTLQARRILQRAAGAGSEILLWALLFALLRGSSELVAEQPPDVERVAALVRRLGHAAYAERQQAAAELAELGPAARAELEAARSSSDLETRLWAERLLAKLRAGDLWSPAIVTVRTTGEPVAQVLDLLSAQSGNRLLFGDAFGAWQNRPTYLDLRQVCFWRALDETCRATGNTVRAHYDPQRSGWVVATGQVGNYPVAYAGPVRAQIVGARRQFQEELDYASLASNVNHAFQFNLQMAWEDRFHLVAYRPQLEVVRAETDVGGQLATVQATTGGWNVATPGAHQLAMGLRLTPPPAGAKRLDVLELDWGLMAVGDFATLTVSDLEQRAPWREPDLELVVEACDCQGPRCELTVCLARDLVVPEPHEVLFQENEFLLFDCDGKQFRQQGQTNALTDTGVRLRLVFAGATASSRPQRLEIRYPRLRAQHDLRIVLCGVPLPQSRPD